MPVTISEKKGNQVNVLVKKICEETGLSREMAEEALQIVINQLNEKLPASSSGPVERVSADVVSTMGSYLGRKTV